MTEQTMTTEEKRRQKIAQLKAKLQKEEARLSKEGRKIRDGQLIAWGVLIEEIYKHADGEGRARLLSKANERLSGRNLERALAGFKRLEPK